MAIQILLADDHRMFREMLREVLTRHERLYAVVGEAAEGGEILKLVARHRPDLLLLDYKMPGLGRFSIFCQAVRRHSPTTRILILSGYADEEFALEAAGGGAKGYILKGASVTDLFSALGTIQAGGIWVDPRLPSRVLHAFFSPGRLGQLSRRELQILSLVAQGRRDKEISTHLHISQKTVKNHLTRIFAKLRVTNRQQAAQHLVNGWSLHGAR
jgi:DNA-binding NarL/FixJ family response regulator